MNIAADQNRSSYSSNHDIRPDSIGSISYIVGSSIAIVGCFIAVLVLGKEFFAGKTSTLVIVAALTWNDLTGVLSMSVIIFHGLVRNDGWIGRYPQCQIQAFFTCASCICSGCIVTFMAIDRTVSLYKPFFYKKAASPSLARVICVAILIFCSSVASLPFMGVGNYTLSRSGSYVCHFDWYSTNPTDKIFIFILGIIASLVILTMIVSNVIVFSLVWKLKKRVCRVIPSQATRSSQNSCIAAKKEQQMAEFVASVSLIFLVTWLPVTVRFFCHYFDVLPNQNADTVATKLAVSGFIANPFTYVIFRNIFKRTLKRSVTVVQNSFTRKLFSKTRLQMYPGRLPTVQGTGQFQSRVTDIFDPRFINRQSEALRISEVD